MNATAATYLWLDFISVQPHNKHSSMDYKEISRTLKQHRIPRTALAERVGVCKGTVAQWLCGRRPIPVRKLAIVEDMLRNESHPDYNTISAFAVRLSGREARRVAERWNVRPTPVAMERLIRRLLLEEAPKGHDALVDTSSSEA